MKVIALYSANLVILLLGLLISKNPVHQKVLAIMIFFGHCFVAYYFFTARRKNTILELVHYGSAIAAFVAAISAMSE